MDRRLEPMRTDRVARAKEAIALRLRPLCAHFSDADFDVMVTRMAELEVKYNMRSEPHRRFNDRVSGPSRS